MQLHDIVAHPLPGFTLPNTLRLVPGGVLFLRSPGVGQPQALVLRRGGKERVILDPGSIGADERTLSLEEQLRRERLRQRSVGVTSYQLAERGSRVLVPLGGSLMILDDLESAPRTLVTGEHGVIEEPRLSPDGTSVGFVRDAELYVVPAAGGEPRQVTSGARGTGRTNGLAEYIAQEEMGRHAGWWWSPDGSRIAFVEVDETHIPAYRIVHQGKDAVGDGAQEDHRYPFAGAANAKVRLGVVSRDGGRIAWMDLGDFEYLARVQWGADGSLWAQTQDRSQRRLDLLRLDPRTGRGEVILTETSETWINLHDGLRHLPDGSFLWLSERTGFRHLYHHARGAVRALTSGEWMVDAVVGADPTRVWYTATADGATEKHLYVVEIGTGVPRRLTPERGMHEVVVDPAQLRFVDLHSAADRPPRVVDRDLQTGAVLDVLADGADDPRVRDLVPPEFVTIPSRDGVPLHAAIFRPEGEGPWPVVVSVYGGPHVQRVVDGWDLTVQLRAQYYRSRGVVVLVLDNRGSARRGLAFESAIHREMGTVEVRDQEDGVRWLVAQGIGDGCRVGIYGWSYGGYLSAMALMRAPDTFRCACAGAPVTHWDGYDTHYTERYMDHPAANADGYHLSSVMAHVGNQRGPLLLVHGLLDENVHFRHTARLVNALNRAEKPYELLMYPDERHMPRGREDRISMEGKIWGFFERNLLP